MQLDLIPDRWLDRDRLCHTGLEALFALGAGGAAAGSSILPAVGAVASLGGTLLSAKAAADQADYSAKVAENEAIALKQRANEEAAAAQRGQIDKLRQAELVQSRARALASASGTSATSPTQIDIEQGIAAQGEFNALSSLYEGMARAQTTQHQAEIDLFKARATRSSMPLVVGGTLLSGLGSFVDKRATRRLLNGQY